MERIRQIVAWLLEDWKTTVPVALFVVSAVLFVQLLAMQVQTNQADQAAHEATMQRIEQKLDCILFGEPFGCRKVLSPVVAPSASIAEIAACGFFDTPPGCEAKILAELRNSAR